MRKLDIGVTVNPFTSHEGDGSSLKSQGHDDVAAKTDEKVIEAVHTICDVILPVWDRRHYSDSVASNVDKLLVLTPSQIDSAFRIVMERATPEILKDISVGVIFSHIMQQSFNNGYNDFIYATRDHAFSFLPSSICGRAEEPLRFTIQGNSTMSGSYSFCRAKIMGDCVGIDLNSITDSHITIYGQIGLAVGGAAQNCIFEAVKKETYESLYVEGIHKTNNTFRHVTIDGKVLEEKKI